ncbi:MAG TPA: MFS transporter [Mycobacteriales bacterium]|nr:MFS transporter [Mycobacteriales bacterium]
MTPLQRLRRATFASLANPNYRLYFGGQAISVIGTWMQTVAQSYLVYTMTGSGTDVGFVVALQTIPVLLLGPYGGVVADRVDKRRMMIALQSMMGVLALTLGLLTVVGAVRFWQIGLLAFLLGLNNTFENPSRQAFVLEMVGPKHIRNAVTLNSVLVNGARAVGPAVAGVIIATAGFGACFLINAASFAAVVSSLLRMDVTALSPSARTARGRGQLREGLRYVRGDVRLVVPLLMMALVGCLAYEFSVSLPVVAKQTFHGGAQTYGFMVAAMGAGAVVGGLYAAGRGRTGLAPLVRSAASFAVCIAVAAVAPNLTIELVALAAVGAASVTFMSKGNSTLQLTAEPTMRGRVMALWAVAFMGSTPFGGPIVGAVAEHVGPRWGLALGALACAAAALLGAAVVRRIRRRDAIAGTGSVPGRGRPGQGVAAAPTGGAVPVGLRPAAGERRVAVASMPGGGHSADGARAADR